MPPAFIDHLTITSPTLAAGAKLVRQALGVTPQTGGEHPRMGTHNLLLRLGEALFLEVISPNPAAPKPARPRWFGLDSLAPDSPPRLGTWVTRTTDIRATASAASEPLGEIETMTRGTLAWLITIPEDGSIPLDGAAPALIEWPTAAHPAATLRDHGLSLARLELFHPQPERLSRLIASIGLQGPISISASPDARASRIVAHINTPEGLRRL